MAVEVIYLQPINYSGAPEDVPSMEYGEDGGEPVLYERGDKIELEESEHARLTAYFIFGDPSDESTTRQKIVLPSSDASGSGAVVSDVDQAGSTAGGAGSVPNVPGKPNTASSAPARS